LNIKFRIRKVDEAARIATGLDGSRCKATLIRRISVPGWLHLPATPLPMPRLHIYSSPPCILTRSALPKLLFPRKPFQSHLLSTKQSTKQPTLTPTWPYLYSRKMAPNLDPFFSQVDSLTTHFIDRLAKAVAIPSVSADEERRPDVVKVRRPHPRADTTKQSRWASFSPPNSKPSAPLSN